MTATILITGWSALALAIVAGCLVPAARLPPCLPNDKLLHLLSFAMLALPVAVASSSSRQAVAGAVILLLAGIIPLGIALQKTGGAAMAADAILGVLGPYGPLATLAAIYLMTSILTEFMSNNASAVLVVPIALATAASMGIDPKPLLIAVAFAASTSFATPISYQTNTMVYTAGGYRFGDFVRVGMPLNVIFWVAAILLIPRFFPFHP